MINKHDYRISIIPKKRIAGSIIFPLLYQSITSHTNLTRVATCYIRARPTVGKT